MSAHWQVHWLGAPEFSCSDSEVTVKGAGRASGGVRVTAVTMPVSAVSAPRPAAPGASESAATGSASCPLPLALAPGAGLPRPARQAEGPAGPRQAGRW